MRSTCFLGVSGRVNVFMTREKQDCHISVLLLLLVHNESFLTHRYNYISI